EINRYISEGKADFVIGRYNNINDINAVYKSNPQLKTKYNLVLSETNDILYSAKKETHKYTFVLFELKK
ncbi:MAG: hypothetical protein KBT46_00510, partial [Ruminococcus sp.]|nr:hypothetical protein [Candidatus Copronaster equi]